MTVRSFWSYVRYLTGPFFRSWWAAITGLASLLAFVVTKDQRFTIGGIWVAGITLLASSLAFLILAIFERGWVLFRGQGSRLHVVAIERSREVPEGWILIIDGSVEVGIGSVVDVHKRTGMAEVPLALVQITARTSSGAYQATPLGRMNPAHIREHSAGGLKSEDLIVRPFVEVRRIREVLNEV